jgi:FkbM family methyltransferase
MILEANNSNNRRRISSVQSSRYGDTTTSNSKNKGRIKNYFILSNNKRMMMLMLKLIAVFVILEIIWTLTYTMKTIADFEQQQGSVASFVVRPPPNKQIRKEESKPKPKQESSEITQSKAAATINQLPKPKESNTKTKSNTIHHSPIIKQCTRNELLRIRSELIPEFCIESLQRNNMMKQYCSYTIATKCPKAIWLEDYYTQLHQERLLLSSSSSEEESKLSSSSLSFLGISVGCNKGFDAINTLRMGTNDNEISQADWQKAMIENDGHLFHSVCGQDSIQNVFQTIIPKNNASTSSSSSSSLSNHIIEGGGEMHCIEPMPETYKKLYHSATTLNYESKGFIVTHAAISKESNKDGMLFPSGGSGNGSNNTIGGIENLGLETCQYMGPSRKAKNHCINVPVLSLKDFITTKVRSSSKDVDTDNNNNNRTINILSIDVEGYDGDVLLGASSEVLNRVEYLEFEYNWMGSWREQHLYDIITMLYEDASMVCYWAGIKKLWRITNCWMLYYDIHSWSNIACVNTNLVPELATKMETIFQNTISSPIVTGKNNTGRNSQGKIVSYEYVPDEKKILLQKGDTRKLPKILAHIAMSRDKEKLAMKYLP